jgi:uncharacterized protein (DUF2267 family)
MSAQGLEVIDRTVEATHRWIHELASRLGWEDRRQVLLLLRATLTALRDMLSHDEAAHLGAQLPILLRGMYYEGWRPSQCPMGMSRAEFVARIERHLSEGGEYDGPADIAEALAVIALHVSPGEIEDVKAALPAEIRAMWTD